MPPKSFKKVELGSKAETTTTTKTDHSKRASYDFGEQGIVNATVPYAGTRRSVNATCNAPELQAGIAKQKADYAKTVFSHAEYRRVPKGERKLKHQLPLEEEYTESGDVTLSRPATETTRLEH